MIITSTKRMKGKEVNSYKIVSEYSSADIKEANGIIKDTMAHAYNIGSSFKAEEIGREKSRRYLSNCEMITELHINGSWFIDIPTESVDKVLFELESKIARKDAVINIDNVQ